MSGVKGKFSQSDRKTLTKGGHLSREDEKGPAVGKSRGKKLPTEGKASAKALRQECVCCI